MSGLTGLYGGPRVVLLPSFALTQADVSSKVSANSLKLADDATLVLEGPHIRIESLSLNGGLTIVNARDDATLVVRDADVSNAGVAFTDIADADLPSSDRSEKIRGYAPSTKGVSRLVGARAGPLGADGRRGAGEGRGQGGLRRGAGFHDLDTQNVATLYHGYTGEVFTAAAAAQRAPGRRRSPVPSGRSPGRCWPAASPTRPAPGRSSGGLHLTPPAAGRSHL